MIPTQWDLTILVRPGNSENLVLLCCENSVICLWVGKGQGCCYLVYPYCRFWPNPSYRSYLLWLPLQFQQIHMVYLIRFSPPWLVYSIIYLPNLVYHLIAHDLQTSLFIKSRFLEIGPCAHQHGGNVLYQWDTS